MSETKSKLQLFWVGYYDVNDNYYEIAANVEDGKVVRMHSIKVCKDSTYIYNVFFAKDGNRFEKAITKFIKRMIRGEITEYKRFVEALNNEFLEKYFEEFYIPKETSSS